MVVAGLMVLIAAQQPRVIAEVDRTRVEVGDEIVLTVRAESAGGNAVRLVQRPRMVGLEIRDTGQSSALELRGQLRIRTTTWEYRLRATTPGRATVAAIRVRVGGEEVETAPLTVDVSAVDEDHGAALAGRVARIVDRAPGPDGSEEVIVSVVPFPDTVVLGEQLDLVVVAWFPRSVRSRLRTRPTLTPPELQGAWTYSPSSALGVAATREIAGRTYDLFVHHQVVFPLTAGDFVVGPATVAYNLPLRMSILSREVPQEVQSEALRVGVLPQPIAGRPATFSGASGAALTLDIVVDTAGFANGEASVATATVAGRGNVALWPEPAFEWPEGIRVYPGRIDVQIDSDTEYVSGSKSFSFLLVPDSVGSFLVPSAAFEYFDLAQHRYREILGPEIHLVARVGAEGSGGPSEPPTVMSPRGVSVLDRWVGRMPTWGWGVVFLLPPLGLLLVNLTQRLSRRAGRQIDRQPREQTLVVVAEMFRRALARLVPDVDSRDGVDLVAALEATGVESPVAERAMHLRDDLWDAMYGPHDSIDTEELVAEAWQLLRDLPGAVTRREGFAHVAASVTVVLFLGAGAAAAQAPTPEQLFEAGAFAQAADSFAQRAAEMPAEAAHWVNLGQALFRAGHQAGARVAWITAGRLRPRDPAVRAALRQSPPLDAISQRLAWVAPVTFPEAATLATVIWVVSFVMLAAGVRLRKVVPLMLLCFVLAGYGWRVHSRYGEAVGLVLEDETPLRVAPYGSASRIRLLEADVAVRVTRVEGQWYLVERGGAVGWVLGAEVGRI